VNPRGAGAGGVLLAFLRASVASAKENGRREGHDDKIERTIIVGVGGATELELGDGSVHPGVKLVVEGRSTFSSSPSLHPGPAATCWEVSAKSIGSPQTRHPCTAAPPRVIDVDASQFGQVTRPIGSVTSPSSSENANGVGSVVSFIRVAP
jgi:hypothetical protein